MSAIHPFHRVVAATVRRARPAPPPLRAVPACVRGRREPSRHAAAPAAAAASALRSVS